jgi:hypothetical protein
MIYDSSNTFVKRTSPHSKLGIPTKLYHVTHFSSSRFQTSRFPSILIRSCIMVVTVTHVHEESSIVYRSIVTWLSLYIKTAVLFFPLWIFFYWAKDRQYFIALYLPVCYFRQVIINCNKSRFWNKARTISYEDTHNENVRSFPSYGPLEGFVTIKWRIFFLQSLVMSCRCTLITSPFTPLFMLPLAIVFVNRNVRDRQLCLII